MTEKTPTDSDEPGEQTKQVNVKFPVDLAERLKVAARMLALDLSHLLRLMVVEKLPEYETRGRVARGLKDGSPTAETSSKVPDS